MDTTKEKYDSLIVLFDLIKLLINALNLCYLSIIGSLILFFNDTFCKALSDDSSLVNVNLICNTFVATI